MRLDAILSQPRIWLDFADMGFEGQGYVGHYNYAKATGPITPHTHDCIEICYLNKGIQAYEIGGQCYGMRGNDLFVTHPSEEHSTAGHPKDKGILYWVQIAVPKPSEPFFGLSYEHAKPIFDQILAISSPHFKGSRRCKHILDELIFAYYNAADDVRRIAVGIKVIEFLLEVLLCASSASSVRPSPNITSLLDYVEMHLDEQISISDMAAVARLSASRLKTKFKQEIGIPPAEYVLRRKIERAKVLLAEQKMPVTQTAHALGFSSSQYFATVFRRFTMMSPMEYVALRDQNRESTTDITASPTPSLD